LLADGRDCFSVTLRGIALHALEWLTAGLAFFALAQVVVQVRSERQRQRERCEDKTRADDEAMQLAWAEYFRIDRLAVEWEKADIVSMAALGVLRASDVLPRDWTTMMGALAHLSIESGYLGGVALTLGHDTERLVATLNSLVEAERAKDNAAFRLRNEYGNASMTYVAKSLRSSQPDAVKELEKHIKGNVRDLANLLWDAVRQSPRTDIIRQLDFHDDMVSSFGKGAVREIKAREQKAQVLKKEPPRLIQRLRDRLRGKKPLTRTDLS
jgi:hypothetical protein